MSFNSPFSNPDQDASKDSTPASHPAPDFNYANVPAYGHSPEVQPTGRNSTMSIVGLVLSILLPLIGLIISIIAWKQAAETGDNRGLAKAGIIVGAVLMVLNVIFSFVMLGAVNEAALNSTLTSP